MNGTLPDASRLDRANPWPGLRPFAEDDSAFFFGRERETRDLLEIVERSTVAVLYGQSGLGKTSLLRAGLFPHLKESGHMPVWVRLDHTAGALPLARQVLDTLTAAFAQQQIEAPTPHEDESLWSYFHRADADFWGKRNQLVTPVIVLDQFEELFTLGQRNAGAAQRSEAFARELEAQFEQRPPASVREHLERHPEDAVEYDLTVDRARFIVSLREDYLPHLDAWRERLPSMLARRYRLEQMNVDQALEVVRCAGGALVDGGVAREIVAFVAEGASATTQGGARVEPAILSVVCDQLNLRRQKAGLAAITRELLSGERSRIIEDFYERSFEGVPDPVREWVEDELLTASGHRDRAAVEDARRAGIDPAAIEQLVDRRVLHSDERNQVVWVEFTHDLLTEPAMASRNERQARQAQATAAAREAVVRDKLKRSRALATVFGLMALVMAGGLVWVNALRNEAQRQTALAEQHQATASDEAGRALRAQGEAQREARRAVSEAERARSAEEEAQRETERAKDNLDKAQQTALTLARQSVEELEAEWLNPGRYSDEVVRTNVLKLETLQGRFGSVTMLRVPKQHALALAAAVHQTRGDEKACTELASQADEIGTARAASVDALKASAMTHLAKGGCLRLRGLMPEAVERFRRSAQEAQGLPVGDATRHRLLVQGALARGDASLQRFDLGEARAALRDVQRLIGSAPTDRLLPGEELSWRVAALSLEAELAGGADEAVTLRERAKRLADTAPRAIRALPGWRERRLEADFHLANALYNAGRNADAEKIEGLDRLVAQDGEDATHPAREIIRNAARRLRAEIVYGWGRHDEASKLLKAVNNSSADIVSREPKAVRARYLLAVSQWLQGAYARESPAAAGEDPAQRRREFLAVKRSAFQRADDVLAAIVADAPQHAESVRARAVMARELGDLSVEESGHKGADVQRQLDAAEAHYRRALSVLDALKHAADQPKIADGAGFVEQSIANLAQRRQDWPGALQAYQRSAERYRAVPVTPSNRHTRIVEVSTAETHASSELRRAGNMEGALEVDRRVLTELTEARKSAPQSFRLVEQMAWVHRMAAWGYHRQGQLTQAIQSQAAAARLMVEALRREPLNHSANALLKTIQKWSNDTLKPAVEKAPTPQLRDLLGELDAMSLARTLQRSSDSAAGAGTPGLPGDWVHVSVQRIRQDESLWSAEVDRLATEGWAVLRGRRLALPFYRDGHLVEFDVRHARGTLGIHSFVTDRDGIAFRLNGKSESLHKYNDTHDLVLRSEDQARLYLRFFVMALEGDEGMFRVVDHPRDLIWSSEVGPEVQAKAERAIEPFEIKGSAAGSWTAQATLHYSTGMFRARLMLPRNGRVEMLEDTSLGQDVMPFVTERYRKGIRVRDESTARFESAVRNRNWRVAADASQAMIEMLLPDTPGAKPQKSLAGQYLRLSWHRLLASEPARALEATTAGLAIDAEYLPLQTNRAHALLLLGREGEAMHLYRAHVGQRMPINQKRLWQDEILNDLAEFEKAGLKDARFAAVRELMLQHSRARP